jgi:hypothetical protein
MTGEHRVDSRTKPHQTSAETWRLDLKWLNVVVERRW